MESENGNGKILTLKEAAEALRVSPTTLYRWIKSGKVPCYKIDGHWRFFEGELRRWVKEHTQEAEDERGGSDEKGKG